MGIDNNDYSDSENQPYPIGENNKDIINNIKNKNNYNKEYRNNQKKSILYGNDRNNDNFDWDSLYDN